MDDPERLLVAIWRPKRTTRFRPIPVVPPTKSDAVAAQRCARLAYRSVRSRLSIQPEANELPVLDDALLPIFVTFRFVTSVPSVVRAVPKPVRSFSPAGVGSI